MTRNGIPQVTALTVIAIALVGCGAGSGLQATQVVTRTPSAAPTVSAAQRCGVTVALLLYKEAQIIEYGGVDTITPEARSYGLYSAVYRTYMSAMPSLAENLSLYGMTEALDATVPQVKSGCGESP